MPKCAKASGIAPQSQGALPCAEAMETLRCALLEKGILKTKDLKALSIPTDQQAEALEDLLTRGPFELIKGGIRVAIQTQIQATFGHSPLQHMPTLGRTLKGASASEVKAAALAMIKTGQARRVLRGKAEWLGAATDENIYLNEDEIKELKSLGLQAAKALRSKPAFTLLRQDIPPFHSDPMRVSGPSRTPQPGSLSAAPLITEIRRQTRPDSDLCFVPDLVMAFIKDHSLNAIHEALRQAAQDRRIELRMESGLYRASGLEMSLCPTGLQDTRLAWIRLLEGAL